MGHPGTTELAKLALTDRLYEYVEKPGYYYERLGSGKFAGALKGQDAVEVYRDLLTGQLYLRAPHCFTDRMVLVKNPNPVAHHVSS